MNFFSPEFFGFFLLIFILYYSVKEEHQKFILFFSSIIFIGLFSISFLVYVFLYITINYFIAIYIEKYYNESRIKKFFFGIGMFLNIGSLIFFKYFNFLLHIISDIGGIFQIPIHFKTINILIPLGISYYTFQGLGYLIQVNRGNEPVERNFIIFSNYYLLFPKFISGPIEISRKLLPQLRKFAELHYQDVIEGFRLILWGAFKKMIIADRLIMVIDGVYPDLHQLSGNPLLLTFFLQPLHIYFDFSGYTDIALGIGRTLGLKLTNNFNRPFFSTGVTEFWKRWHISLSSWCNEFIFMRLLFKKRNWGIWASVYSVFITFLVIGIWHGPRWTFIILGILQGLAINYEFFTKKIRHRIAGKFPVKIVLYSSYFFTYLFVGLTMVFFYSPNLRDAFYFLNHMFHDINITKLNLVYLQPADKLFVFFPALFILIVEFRQENGKDFFNEINLWKKWQRRTFYYILVFLIIYFGSPVKEFIYAQF